MKRIASLFFTAAALLWAATAFAAEPHWPPFLVIGTASPGGTYHAYGEGLARLLTRELGIPVSMRATEGPSENMKLIEQGDIHLGFVTLGVALQGWNGTGAWTGGKQLRAARAIFPMYDTPMQFMAPDAAGIAAIADLAGKRVGIGPAGGTGGTYMPDIFKALKVDATLVTGEWADLSEQVKKRSLDALAVAAGVPFPSFADLERAGRVRYLPLAPKQIVDLRLAIPELGASLVPAGSYPSLRRHYQTVGFFNFAVAHQSLPDDLVYAIVDAVFSNHEEMMDIHAAAAETVPVNFTRNSFLPFHTGAARWYNNNSVPGIVKGD